MPAPDIVIIGSGMGGATLAAGLAATGARITILERGRRIPDDAPARDPNRIFRNSAFLPAETWLDADGRRFSPGNYYQVGGNSKLYGAVLLRYRAEDFAEMRHLGGVSPAWPFDYAAIEPWYSRAEHLYQVRGTDDDPTSPPRSAPYPFPPVPDEPCIAAVRQRLTGNGVHPFTLPLGVDIDRWLKAGATGWDGYPDTRCGKMDAETCGLAQALSHPNVTLVEGAEVTALVPGPDGRRIDQVRYRVDGEDRRETPGIVCLCAGAVQSAALLLRSGGVANAADQVGRCFMNHNATGFVAIAPRFDNTSVYQKTFGINDWYLSDGAGGPPLGNMQLLGRVVPDILQAQVPSLPMPVARWVSRHALDLYAISEDLPDPESRVVLDGPDIRLLWRRSNMAAHRRLVARVKRVFRAAGFPVILSRLFDGRVPSHQCGTLRMGSDPARSVVDPDGRAWDHPNLFVADAGVLPTSAAVNPALTVAALALRTAATIARAGV